MPIELEPSHYAATRPLFAALDQHLSLHAVLDGTMPGAVYADDAAAPTAALVWSPEGAYLAAASPSAAVASAFQPVVQEIMEYSGGDTALFAEPAAWKSYLATLFQPHEPQSVQRRAYTLRQLAGAWHQHVPPGTTLQPLDASFFQQTHLVHYDYAARWASNNWGSIEQFVAHGLGFALVRDDLMLSWCLADCISGSRCEIGIHTDADNRRQGYASIVVAATVAAALGRGLSPIGWHCADENLASQRLAEKIGFSLSCTFPAYFCSLDEE
ncbi:MAG: GNAT family N-acetyltransferase [Chloroflexaceae bacterium]|nr:GNAT family N-acetyltransferase [Chloroflexaceae bacterium]